MKRIFYFLATFCFFIALLGCSSASFATIDYAKYSGTYKEKIEAFVKDNESTTAGMSVSVFNANDILYSGTFGYSNKEPGIPLSQNTVLEWGSCTKLLVWVSVMQLYEQGKIDLQKDIRQYLPDGFLKNLTFKTPVTMTHLMNHTAGFQEMYFDIFAKKEKHIKPLDVALCEYQPRQIFEPGTVTSYSNYGCALAGFIVERIAGIPFYEYVEKNIFAPLKMQNTSIRVAHNENKELKTKWQELKCYRANGKYFGFSSYYVLLYPAGSCISTPTDFCIFAQELLNKGKRLFAKEETWNVLFSPTSVYENISVPKNCHGFWMIPFADQTFGHGGNTPGCSSYILLQPQNNLGAVVMTNQPNEVVFNFYMMNLIFGEYNENNYFANNKIHPSGMYKSCRNKVVGPVKILGLPFYSFKNKHDFFVASGDEKLVCTPYKDFESVSCFTVVFELAICVLWGLAIFVSFAWSVVRLICILLKQQKFTMPFYTKLLMLLQTGFLLLLAYFICGIAGYAVAKSYIWVCNVFAFIPALFAALGFLLCRKLVLQKKVGTQKETFLLQKSENLKMIFSVAIIVVFIVNICYWNLAFFWLV